MVEEGTGRVILEFEDRLPESGSEPARAVAQTADALVQGNDEVRHHIAGRPAMSLVTEDLGLPLDLAAPLATAAGRVPLPQDDLVGKAVMTLRWTSLVVGLATGGGLPMACLDLVRAPLARLVGQIAGELLIPKNRGAQCRRTRQSKVPWRPAPAAKRVRPAAASGSTAMPWANSVAIGSGASHCSSADARSERMHACGNAAN